MAEGSANFWLSDSGKEAGSGLGTCPGIKNYIQVGPQGKAVPSQFGVMN